jgi:hypothetical protein
MSREFPVPLLPPHLVPIAIVESSKNLDTHACTSARIACRCGGNRFAVRYVGREADGFIGPVILEGRAEFAVRAECQVCKALLDVFDSRLHGWGPVLSRRRRDPGGCSFPRAIWSCRQCGEVAHAVAVMVGWAAFDEVAEDMTDMPEFDERLWTEAFETIQISLRCSRCSLQSDRWVEFEIA